MCDFILGLHPMGDAEIEVVKLSYKSCKRLLLQCDLNCKLYIYVCSVAINKISTISRSMELRTNIKRKHFCLTKDFYGL